jgi:hypothetical protein
MSDQMKPDFSPSHLLIGYARRSNVTGTVKLSINKEAFDQAETYSTSDGQTYIPLVISLSALRKVIEGERSITTISQLLTETE